MCYLGTLCIFINSNYVRDANFWKFVNLAYLTQRKYEMGTKCVPIYLHEASLLKMQFNIFLVFAEM